MDIYQKANEHATAFSVNIQIKLGIQVTQEEMDNANMGDVHYSTFCYYFSLGTG